MKVWIQSNLNGLEWGRFPIWTPIFDFAEDALQGALESDMEVVRFQGSDIHSIPVDSMVVGSVETTEDFFRLNKIPVPREIDHSAIDNYRVERTILKVEELEEILFPCFVKPVGQIKRFTGGVFTSLRDLGYVLDGYTGKVAISPIVNILSEWRCYISQGKLLKISHYQGEPLIFPDPIVVDDAWRRTKHHNLEASYTIDFGVTAKKETFVVEMNDGWALGNYGLAPYDYFQFLRRRWVQINQNVWK